MLKILGEEWLGQGKGQSECAEDDDRSAILDEQDKQEVASPLHNRATVLTDLETEQSLPHKECTGSETIVSDELGTTDSMGREA